MRRTPQIISRLFSRPPTLNRLYIQTPEANANRSGIAICAVVKNEETILREWLLHHRNIGVRHFFLYDNKSSDSTIEIARATLQSDALTVIPWALQASLQDGSSHLHQQTLAFAHWIETFGASFKYAAFIDPDEFIIPKKHFLLEKALAEAGNPPNMALPWHMFGRSGHDTPPDGGVGANFMRRYRDIHADYHMSKFKCIVDPCEVTRVGVHVFETRSEGNTSSNDVGRRVSNSKRFVPDFVSGEAIQLNHYFTRSDSELRKKIARSSNQIMEQSAYERRVMSRVEKIESDEIEDRSILELRDRAPDLEWL